MGCDGLKSSVRKKIGIDHGRKYPVRFGLNRHYESKLANTYVEIYWSKDFEVYITPVEQNVVNFAVLFSVGRPFDEFLNAVPGLFEKIGQPLSSVRGEETFYANYQLQPRRFLHAGVESLSVARRLKICNSMRA